MKESFADKVRRGLETRVEKVSDKIAKDLGNVKPFDSSPMTREEKIREWDEITPEEFEMLRMEMGDQALMDWANEIRQLRGM